MSNLSEFFPAGAGKQVSFVASGSISNGATVILNANGTVSAVSGQNFSSGSEVVFDSDDSPTDIACCYDSTENKVIIVYRDGNDSFAVVGTVSGSSISFGTPVTWHSESYYADELSVAYDSNADRIVIAYRLDSGAGYGYTIVGEVSGTTISFGTQVVFRSVATRDPIIVFDSDQNKVVIYYQYAGINAMVGTVSGSSISFGSEVDLTNGEDGEGVSAVFDTNAGKHVVTYRQSGGSESGSGNTKVGTVSGTSISFGSMTSFSLYPSTNVGRPICFDSTNNKVVIFFRDGNNSNILSAVVGTVSGTSISFGTVVATTLVLNDSAGLGGPSTAIFDSSGGVVACVFEESNETFLLVGKVSGTSINLDPIITLNDGNRGRFPKIVYDTNAQKSVVSYQDQPSSSDGTSVVLTLPATNVTSSNFLGVSEGAISDGSSGSITVKGGVSSNVSSLTANSVYYVAKDGTFTTTSTNNVLAGRAISSTSIDLDYST